jgi:hypothetical protein
MSIVNKKPSTFIISCLFAQLFVYLFFNRFFEFYFIIIILASGFLISKWNQRKSKNDPRIFELALVETWFVLLIYGLYCVGWSSNSQFLLIIFFILPQTGLFLLATYKSGNHIKGLNTLVHLFFLCYLLQNKTTQITSSEYPILLNPIDNYYYSIFYLVWVIPFVLTAKTYNSIGFIITQLFSLFLAFLHEDFLSMRLFTAQISFVLMSLFEHKREAGVNQYFNLIHKYCPLLVFFILILILIIYFRVF